MMRSDASLKGKIKAMAKKSNLKPQELLQMYLFEHLLMRLDKSDYSETFVLKGGLLISSMTGVAQRTTGDEIVPRRIEYRFPLMFEDGSARILSYPIETVLHIALSHRVQLIANQVKHVNWIETRYTEWK